MSVEDFTYEVTVPNPDAPKLRSRRQGFVRAFANGVCVGSLDYGLGPPEGTLVVTGVEVEPAHWHLGCATGMLLRLRSFYSGMPVRDSPTLNTPDGDGWLAAMCHQGLIDHDYPPPSE